MYDYVCRKCGATFTTDRRPLDKKASRHLVGGKVCGTFRSDYRSVNLNKVNLRGR